MAVFIRVHRSHKPSFKIGNDYNLFVLLDRFVALCLWVRECFYCGFLSLVAMYLNIVQSAYCLFEMRKKASNTKKKFSIRTAFVCPIDEEHTRCTKIYGYVKRLYTNQFTITFICLNFHCSCFIFIHFVHCYRGLLCIL